MASRIASRWRAEPRPGGDDRQVDRLPAASRRPRVRRDHLDSRALAGDAAPGCDASGREEASRGRQGRRRRAARRRRRGARRRRRSGRRGAARRRCRCPPSASGLARPERVAVVADPGPRRRVAAERRRHPGEVGGQRHLEVARDRRARHGPGWYRPRAGRPRRSTSRVRRPGTGRAPRGAGPAGRPAASAPSPGPSRSTVARDAVAVDRA